MKSLHLWHRVACAAALCILGNTKQAYSNESTLAAIPKTLQDALSYASLAPSSHNAQMWKVSYSPSQSTLTIALDKTRSLAKVDPLDREGYISIGTYAQTLEDALIAYGYAPTIQITEKKGDAIVLVNLQAPSSTPPDKVRLALLEKRHTDKRLFSCTPLRSQDIATVITTDMESLSFVPRGSENYSYLANGAIKAMEIQAANQEKRNELSEWLRYSNKEKEEKMDGLPAEQLGITGVKKFFYYLFVDKKYAQSDSYAKQGIDMTRDQAENNAGFFVLTGGNTPPELIRTGMALQRMWLAATRVNIAIHPMSQMLEEEPFRSEIQTRLGKQQPVQMVLRAGYVSSYGKNNKIRRDISQFLTLEP